MRQAYALQDWMAMIVFSACGFIFGHITGIAYGSPINDITEIVFIAEKGPIDLGPDGFGLTCYLTEREGG